MDIKKMANDIAHEVTAKGGHARRHNRVSPYKKELNRTSNALNAVLNDPSDSNIRRWAMRVLVDRIGVSALKLDVISVNDIRTIALLLAKTTGHSDDELNDWLVDGAKYTLNRASDQFRKLVDKLNTEVTRSGLSQTQLTEHKIGTTMLINKTDTDPEQKNVDTRKGLR